MNATVLTLNFEQFAGLGVSALTNTNLLGRVDHCRMVHHKPFNSYYLFWVLFCRWDSFSNLAHLVLPLSCFYIWLRLLGIFNAAYTFLEGFHGACWAPFFLPPALQQEGMNFCSLFLIPKFKCSANTCVAMTLSQLCSLCIGQSIISLWQTTVIKR